jgi:hypothetical protein
MRDRKKRRRKQVLLRKDSETKGFAVRSLFLGGWGCLLFSPFLSVLRFSCRLPAAG